MTTPADVHQKPCLCPAPVDVVTPIDGPVKCSCCGEPLVLSCPGACGAEHVTRSLEGARARLRVPRTRKERTKETTPRTYKPKVCACGATFPPTGPRDIRCIDCKKALIDKRSSNDPA